MQKPLILPWKGVWPTIAADAFIAPNATIIGDVHIGPQSSVWFGVVIRGDVNHIRIGARTNIQDLTMVHVASETGPTVIGDDVLIGHTAIIHGCTLENGAFVGMRATVMDYAVVESKAMVAAGALVGPGKRIPGGQLWAGTPAKFMRDLKPEEIADFKHSTDHYAGIGQTYRSVIADLG